MNKSAFLKLIQENSNISDQLTEELEKVAVAFPYCQTAHLLLAKSAHEKGSMLSTQKLRRAAAYATDRQLLKKIIYTSPAPEPVFEEARIAEADYTLEEVIVVDVAVDEAVVIDAFASDDTAPAPDVVLEAEVAEQAETFPTDELPAPDDLAAAEAEAATYATDEDDTDAEVVSASEATEEEVAAAEADFESELALLLTFNSLSSSSTDLLAAPEAEPAVAEEPEQYVSAEHIIETEEALAELEYLEEAAPEELEVQVLENAFYEEAIPAPAVAQMDLDEEPDDAEHSVFAQADAAIVSDDDVAAPINYSSDEIDRLYAEDALGYWMGSSRMGEVLQLKDDYTRPKPFDFHPELILEYSKTHELEKQAEPAAQETADQFDIIDHFLKLNPRLNSLANARFKTEPQEDLSLKSTKIKRGMASENLANIFLKQGKVKKAVKIYEQLILKYPEKKSYFAEQIEKLQNIT